MHHGVDITDPAIVAAAELSHRYITDRFLPDKAIDLIDEAAARIRMEIDSKPEAMDKLDRRLIQLKIEREAVKKEADDASKKRLGLIEREIGKLEREKSAFDELWRSEKANVAGAQHIKEEVDKVRLQMEEARRKGDWQTMSELQYGELAATRGATEEGGQEAGEGRGKEAAALAHRGRRRGDRGGHDLGDLLGADFRPQELRPLFALHRRSFSLLGLRLQLRQLPYCSSASLSKVAACASAPPSAA